MTFQNSQLGFFYRQIFLCPASLPKSLSLASQTAIITGSNTGLGFSAAAQLLERGLSHLILAVRTASKGEAARLKLLEPFKESGSVPTIEVWELDLSSYASTTAFTQRIKQSPLYFDIIILNAGIVNAEFKLNQSTKNEEMVQTNWLSTALLTMLLQPILALKYGTAKKSGKEKPPVMSIVGSETAGWAGFKERKVAEEEGRALMDVLNDKKDFDANDRYYTSKLLWFLFFVEYTERLGSGAGENVIINVVNPGFCYGTDLHRNVLGVTGRVLGTVKRVIGRSTEVGARTIAWSGAVAGGETHGMYTSDERVAEFFPFVLSEKGVEVRKKLWTEMIAELKRVEGFVEPPKVL